MTLPIPRQFLVSGGVILLAIVGLFGVLPQLAGFDGSLDAMSGANMFLVGLAFLSVVGAYLCASAMYQLLSYRRLKFRDTLMVQLAGLLVNRVLPAGIGGLGLNYLYLRKHRHTAPQSATVVALNNLTGMIGHVLLLVLVLCLLQLTDQSGVSIPTGFMLSKAQVLFGLAVVGVVLLVLYKFRSSLITLRRNVIKQIVLLVRYYSRRPQRLLAALGVSWMLTMSNVLCLWLCCLAVGVELNVVTVFLVFTFGVAIGTAVPSPGGLGGTEAALVGALISQHVSPVNALATVLLYRLVSFWLGLGIGAVALYGVHTKGLLSLTTKSRAS